jgi:hypothetical protein
MNQERHSITLESSFWIHKLDRADPREVEWITETNVDGTNTQYPRYIFRFPDMWRQIYDKDLTMVLRSITSIPFPRSLMFSGLLLTFCPRSRADIQAKFPDDLARAQQEKDWDIDRPISINLDLSVALPSREGMTEANAMIQAHLLQIINSRPEEEKKIWSCCPIDIFYDQHTSEFAFDVNQPQYMIQFESRSVMMSTDWENFTNTIWRDYVSIGSGYNPNNDKDPNDTHVYPNVIGSNYSWTNWHASQYYNPSIFFEGGSYKKRNGIAYSEIQVYDATVIETIEGMRSFRIRNVWGRERIIVKSNLDPYEEYIGYTNITYGPPKQFPLNKHDDTFWIELYDAFSREHVMMPADGKDTVVLEAQFVAS